MTNAATSALPTAPHEARAARMRLAWWWWHTRMGWPAALAVAALIAALALAFIATPMLEARRDAQLRSNVQQAEAQRMARLRQTQRDGDGRAPWLAELAPWPARHDTFKALFDAARTARIDIERSVFETEATRHDLKVVHVQMMVVAPYERVRAYAAEALNALPNAALDAIELDTTHAADARQVSAKLNWTLYFKEGA